MHGVERHAPSSRPQPAPDELSRDAERALRLQVCLGADDGISCPITLTLQLRLVSLRTTPRPPGAFVSRQTLPWPAAGCPCRGQTAVAALMVSSAALPSTSEAQLTSLT